MSPERTKQLTLTAAILGSAIVLLDGTIVSVALPTIQRSLGGGLADQQWVSSAYLIEAPRLGWSAPEIIISLLAGTLLLAGFLTRERLARDPMLPLSLFRRRNFAAANTETLAVYAALGVFFFFLILYLQQVAGYSPLRGGLAVLPATVVMFLFSRRVGRLSARFGPRLFMSVGPLLASAGLLLALRIGRSPGYFSELLPAVGVFALGLSLTVAPLTTTVLAGVERERPVSPPRSTTRSRGSPACSAWPGSGRSSRHSSARR